MGKRKMTRLLALIMAVVCTLSVVLAAGTFDLNGDGKTNIWDLQLVLNKGESESYATALEAVLGGVDELSPNEEGVYEIASPVGLKNMVKLATKGYSFRLVKDIDLQGADWVPVVFAGEFDGNGHTISNVKITEDNDNGSRCAMGFFATINEYTKAGQKQQSVVRNLHLENVELVATENSSTWACWPAQTGASLKTAPLPAA